MRSYEETNERSALGRLHFWQVALDMVADHPMGVGLFNFEAAYDQYDFTNGRYGRNRSVHSSHFQVLAETGYLGMFAWTSLLVYSFASLLRIRRRASYPDLAPDDANLFLCAANGLIASLAAFVVGGSFVAMALNDLTWLLFAMVASLDLISRRLCEEVEVVHSPTTAAPPLLTWKPTSVARRDQAWS
jgi:O-antigen ligase